ncbi:hypothetical protein GCM10023144_24520 [Pigmentiphaga soli]|uniref:AB hydrolase-1 domain-containing protein n=1 Tax=Pigmentiphaga soli TaxID=1007095 RepID=A0ABP8H2A4_9BURK
MNNTSNVITVGEVDIEYRVVCCVPPWLPAPPTVLFYNGNSRGMDIWLPWVPELARRYRVVMFNPRGIGASTHPAAGQRYDADVLVRDAMGLLDAVGVREAHWIGESSGGVLGLAAALAFPERLASLVLINTPFRFPRSVGEIYLLGEKDFATTIGKYGVEDWSRRTLAYRLDLAKASPQLQEWLVKEMGKVPPQVMIDHFQLSIDADLVKSAPALKLPILNLVGDGSPLAEKSQMEYVQRHLPDAELVVIDGYGHGVNLLAPELCVERTLAFLARLSPT